ncbi:hypothetical protein LTSERUB_0265, partial [Salmonella enterica subsp. enterica serovar Rubislaw str. A4-653]
MLVTDPAWARVAQLSVDRGVELRFASSHLRALANRKLTN